RLPLAAPAALAHLRGGSPARAASRLRPSERRPARAARGVPPHPERRYATAARLPADGAGPGLAAGDSEEPGGGEPGAVLVSSRFNEGETMRAVLAVLGWAVLTGSIAAEEAPLRLPITRDTWVSNAK